jgi:hypothetical protein
MIRLAFELGFAAAIIWLSWKLLSADAGVLRKYWTSGGPSRSDADRMIDKQVEELAKHPEQIVENPNCCANCVSYVSLGLRGTSDVGICANSSSEAAKLKLSRVSKDFTCDQFQSLAQLKNKTTKHAHKN